MRIVLVGSARDRDRVRSRLVDAGFEIVAEAPARPKDAALDGVEAIVEARTDGLAEALVEEEGLARDRDIAPESLTPREHEVLALLADGLPNKAIAAALDISDQTVKFHVAAIIAKLGAANRTDAVRRAIRRGLVAI